MYNRTHTFTLPDKKGVMFVSSDGTVSSLESRREKKHTNRKTVFWTIPIQTINCNLKYMSFREILNDPFFSNHPTALQCTARLFLPREQHSFIHKKVKPIQLIAFYTQ